MGDFVLCRESEINSPICFSEANKSRHRRSLFVLKLLPRNSWVSVDSYDSLQIEPIIA